MQPRTLVSVAGLIASAALLAWQVGRVLDDPTVWPPDDFVEYWAAGRLALGGDNPYSPPRLLDLERAAGRDTDEAVMMWNPPWTLSFVMPLGLLPARVAQLLWLGVGAAGLAGAAVLLGRAYPFPPAYRWVPWAITFTFFPTFLVLRSGQIGPLLVIGGAGFAWAVRAGRPAAAGAAAVLLAIKPHLVYLLWVALVADAVFNRRWRMLAGGVAAGAVAAAVPLAFNPDSYAQYAAAMRDHPPAQWVSLTPGTLLRFAFGAERFWLQFVPVALGVVWLAGEWRARGRGWNWLDEFPRLVVVSFVTSPYGAWHFDLVVLLVPLIHAAARLVADGRVFAARLAAVTYLAANVAMLALNVLGVESVWFAWVAPLILVAYFWAAGRPSPGRGMANP